MKNSDLKLAGFIALVAHAGMFFGISPTARPEFDVQRAPSSMEVYLVPSISRPPSQPPLKVEKVKKPETISKPELEPIPEPEPTPEPEPQPKEVEIDEAISPKPEYFIEPERGAITQAKPDYLRNPPPVYPRRARERGLEGAVLLRVEVLPTGESGRIKIVKSSGHLILDEATLKAVRKWKFRPAKLGRIPVTAWVEVPIRFVLK